MLGLHDLPRYNDYDPDGEGLSIRLDDTEAFQQVFGGAR